MDWTLEVVVVPVSDIDRSIAFYRDQVGFDLDHDTQTEHMHVAQLTPRGSGCSIVIGDLPGSGTMAPGSLKGVAARRRRRRPRRARSCSTAASRRARSPSSTHATAAPSSGSPIPTATPGPCSRSKVARRRNR